MADVRARVLVGVDAGAAHCALNFGVLSRTLSLCVQFPVTLSRVCGLDEGRQAGRQRWAE